MVRFQEGGEKMSFIERSTVLAKRKEEIAKVAAYFREEIEKKLEGYNGNDLAVTIPNGLSEEALQEIIADLKASGWDASVYDAPRGEGNMLNIK